MSQSREIHTGALCITVIEQDETGEALRQSVHLDFIAEQYAEVLKLRKTFRKLLQTQPGATTLRMLVQDPGTAAIGSLIIPPSHVN